MASEMKTAEEWRSEWFRMAINDDSGRSICEQDLEFFRTIQADAEAAGYRRGLEAAMRDLKANDMFVAAAFVRRSHRREHHPQGASVSLPEEGDVMRRSLGDLLADAKRRVAWREKRAAKLAASRAEIAYACEMNDGARFSLAAAKHDKVAKQIEYYAEVERDIDERIGSRS